MQIKYPAGVLVYEPESGLIVSAYDAGIVNLGLKGHPVKSGFCIKDK